MKKILTLLLFMIVIIVGSNVGLMAADVIKEKAYDITVVDCENINYVVDYTLKSQDQLSLNELILNDFTKFTASIEGFSDHSMYEVKPPDLQKSDFNSLYSNKKGIRHTSVNKHCLASSRLIRI